jgi:uncharacterized protein (TIGR03435 family)
MANGRAIDPKGITMQVLGGPGWVDSDYYEIVAKAEGAPGQAIMHGPMMQSLLEERFKLKLHRETKQVPVFVLSVAKGGPRRQATKTGTCVSLDLDHLPSPPVSGQSLPRTCGGAIFHSNGIDYLGLTLAELCNQLYLRTNRIVIDKTGMQGMFDIHLELSPSDVVPAAQMQALGGIDPAASRSPLDDPPHSSVFDAIKKLGLKLESGRGPREVPVIDHIEKPSAN